MKGTIRTEQKCPVCKGAFQQIRHPLVKKRIIDLMCPTCLTRPTSFFIDGRWLKDREGAVGRISCDQQDKPFDSFLAADRCLEAIRKQIDDKTFRSDRWKKEALGKFLLSKACEPWIEHLKRNHSEEYAHQERRHIFCRIIPALGDMDVRDIRGFDIEQLGVKLRAIKTRKGTLLKENSVRNYLSTLQTLLNWLVKKEMIDRAPSFPPLGSVPRENVGWIEKEDQELIISFLREDMRLMARTMMEAGLRPGEAIALKVRDLRDCAIFIERSLTMKRRIKGTKTGVTSLRPIKSTTFAALEDLAGQRKFPESFLFLNRAGKPFHPQRFSIEWRKAADKAGIDVCLSVASRHSRVSQSRMEMEKEMLERLRKELAHTNSATTIKHYMRDEREKLGQQTGGTSQKPL